MADSVSRPILKWHESGGTCIRQGRSCLKVIAGAHTKPTLPTITFSFFCNGAVHKKKPGHVAIAGLLYKLPKRIYVSFNTLLCYRIDRRILPENTGNRVERAVSISSQHIQRTD